MGRVAGVCLLALAASLCGCLTAKETTVLKADGSGTYVQVLTLDMAKAKEYQLMLQARASELGVPPDGSEGGPLAGLAAERRQKMLERAGLDGTVTSSLDKENAKQTHELKVAFKSLRRLFEAGVVEDMTVKLERVDEGKAWKLSLRHALDHGVAKPETDSEKSKREQLRNMRAAMLKRVERWWGKLEVDSRLTLPSRVIETNGKVGADKRTVTWNVRFKDLADPANLRQWVTFEHAKGLSLKPFSFPGPDESESEGVRPADVKPGEKKKDKGGK